MTMSKVTVIIMTFIIITDTIVINVITVVTLLLLGKFVIVSEYNYHHYIYQLQFFLILSIRI